MGVKEAAKDWNAFTKRDSMWAILTDPHKRGRRWNAHEFFATGVTEIEDLMRYLHSLGVSVSNRRALDFGCGIGRLTQALTRHFGEVHGVDVASSMIGLANQHNQWPEKCFYHVNESGSLSIFESNTFDLIYSNLVLQHIEPRDSKVYLREFVRVLAPGGIAVFQLPSVPSTFAGSLNYRARQAVKGAALAISRRTRYFARPLMLMYGVRRDEVERILMDSGTKIIDVMENKSAGEAWTSFRYCVSKV